MKRGFSKLKVYDLRKHFKKRLRERFGISLNRYEYKALLEVLKEEGQFYKKDTNRKYWYLLTYKGYDMYLLYDISRNECITVYTEQMIIENM